MNTRRPARGAWAEWDAAHPGRKPNRSPESIARRRAYTRAWLSARRIPKPPKPAAVILPPLTPLFPDLVHGARVSFWEDELRMDLAQERSLALVAGEDPELAVRAYRARETAWRRMTCPLVEAA